MTKRPRKGIGRAIAFGVALGIADLFGSFLTWAAWDAPGPEPAWVRWMFDVLSFPVVMFGLRLNGGLGPALPIEGRTVDLFPWLFVFNGVLWMVAGFVAYRAIAARFKRPEVTAEKL